MARKSQIADRPRSELALQTAIEVRAWMARRRISASRAADTLGWSQPYMSQRLNGRHAFDLDDLNQLADLLEVPVVAFFDAPATLAAPLAGGELRRLRATPFPPARQTPPGPPAFSPFENDHLPNAA